MTAHLHGDGSNSWSPPPSSRFAEAAGESGTGGRRKLNIGSLPPCLPVSSREGQGQGVNGSCMWSGGGTRAGMVPPVSCVLLISLTSLTAAHVDFSVVSFRFLPSIPLSLFSQTYLLKTLFSNIPLRCRLLGEDLPKLTSSCCGVQVSQLSSGPRIHPLHILSLPRYLPLTVN